MHLAGTAGIGLPADRVTDLGLACVLIALRASDRWCDGEGRPVLAMDVVTLSPEEEATIDSTIATEDGAESILSAVCNRTDRTVRAVVLTPGTLTTINARISGVHHGTSALEFTADVQGGTVLVRWVLKLARRFAEPASDALVTELVRDFEREAEQLEGVRLDTSAPAVVQLRPREPEPPIPRVPRLGTAVAAALFAVLLSTASVCGVLTIVLGFPIAALITAVLVTTALVAIFTLGPRQVRKTAESVLRTPGHP
jgi:hypothetical protein